MSVAFPCILYLRDFLVVLLATLLSCPAFRRFLPRQDHFAAHQYARFEGYYTRIQTEDNTSIVLIISSVPNASNGLSHFVHFSVIPFKGSSVQPIRIDQYPETIEYRELHPPLSDGRQAFQLHVDGIGTYAVDHDVQTYELELLDPENSDSTIQASIVINNRSPLKLSNLLSTPHGLVVSLGNMLPLHWHIFSTHSTATYVVRRRGAILLEGKGAAHMEKNWGKSFPDGWTWMQAFGTATSVNASIPTLALAGGNILGAKAYLVVYRSPALHWDFAPPWTLMLGNILGCAGWSFFTTETTQIKSNSVVLDVRSLTQRLVIRAKGSTDLNDWMHLDCPLLDGYGHIAARETFSAHITVDAYTRSLRRLREGWRKVESQVFEDAAFELGGNYRSRSMIEMDKYLEELNRSKKAL